MHSARLVKLKRHRGGRRGWLRGSWCTGSWYEWEEEEEDWGWRSNEYVLISMVECAKSVPAGGVVHYSTKTYISSLLFSAQLEYLIILEFEIRYILPNWDGCSS